MKNKTDQRSRYTQSIVKQAMIKCLGESELKDVTVSALCEKAGICRGTFYNQFFDVYDVYESLEEEFYQEITQKLAAQCTYSVQTNFFREISYYILQNVDWFKIIFSNQQQNNFIRRIIDFIKERYIIEYSTKFPTSTLDSIKNVFTYATSGSISILTNWVMGGAKQSAEHIADIINNLNAIIIQEFFGKHNA